ncbi:MAG: hypothetical protein H6641_18420 [Caldilineaceae bacterium]|nr:hypothetical protein [Caldilineaceae bacterium]
MKHLIGLIILGFVGYMGFRIGGELSSDAFGMAIGMLLGIMAGIPTALLVLASARRRDDYDSSQHTAKPRQLEQQPPAQVTNNYITHNHLHVHGAPGAQLSAAPRDRRAEIEARHQLTGSAPEMPAPQQFRIIGEIDESAN